MSVEQNRCPLTSALDVLGGKWSLIVLYALADRPRWFDELQRLTPGVSHKVLTDTLRRLEAAGLVNREVMPSIPPCVLYSLSAHGETVRPVIEVVRQWGHVQLARMAVERVAESGMSHINALAIATTADSAL